MSDIPDDPQPQPPFGESATVTKLTPHKWVWLVVAAWIVFVAYGIILELWTAFDGSDTTPPLTWLVMRYVPELFGIGFTSWLLYHFATEYWKKGRGGNGD
jgi:hypothetical protein